MRAISILGFFIAIIIVTPYTAKSQNWEAVGGGLGDLSVGARVLFADTTNNLLYAGGTFINAGGISAWGIASWNGLSWDSLGSGLRPCCGGNNSAPVSSILRYQGDIYVAGSFDSIGGVYANSVARWDGTNWFALGEGVKFYEDTTLPPPFLNNHGAISDLIIFENELYVFGCFDTAGGIPVDDIAKWNGTSWASISTGLDCFSGPAGIYHDSLYIGANFDTSFGFKHIGLWDGSTWKSVGGGLTGVLAFAGSFTVFEDELYVGGYYFKTEGNPGNCIAKWNGSVWSDVGGGMNAQVNALKVFNNELFAAGSFIMAGGVPADRIAKWNGTEWCGLGSVFSNNVILDLEVWNNELYAVGSFRTIDGDTMLHIAKWIGGNFTDSCGVFVNTNEPLPPANTEINIYPNPTSGNVMLSFDLKQGTEIDVKLYNAVGQLLTLERLKAQSGLVNYELNLDNISTGIYMIILEMNDAVIGKKFVKL